MFLLVAAFAYAQAGQAVGGAGDESASPLRRLISEDALKSFGLRRADADRALDSFGVDVLTWRIVIVTGTIGTGRDPFSWMWGSPDGIIGFGIGSWSSREGKGLWQLLKKMRAADSEYFDGVMGNDRRMIEWVEAPRETALRITPMDFEPPEPWKTRFADLGRHHQFQRIQLQELKPRVDRAREQMSEAGLRSERALAFTYDLLASFPPYGGWRSLPSDRAAFRDATGRDPDEQETMLIIGNRPFWLATFPEVSERRQAFALGHGVIRRRAINLDQASIGMRDINTGAPIPLVNDQFVLDRLVKGWIPGAKRR